VLTRCALVSIVTVISTLGSSYAVGTAFSFGLRVLNT
jgi:hypothetical protein